MGKKNIDRRESSWLTVGELANALDTTESFVRREVLRRVPADMVRRDVKPMRVYGRGAIECWLRGSINRSAASLASAAEFQAVLDDLAMGDGLPDETATAHFQIA